MRDETAESIFNAQTGGFFCPNLVKVERSPYIEYNQMKLVKVAKANKITHIIFIETDNVFPPWAIEQLIDDDKMVVGASYNFKTLSPPGCKKQGVAPLVKMWDENGKPRDITMEELPPTLFKCYSIPNGFMLVDMKVFDLISYPYFKNDWEGDGFKGGDVYFCENVRRSGIDVWCDPTVVVGHIGSYTY